MHAFGYVVYTVIVFLDDYFKVKLLIDTSHYELKHQLCLLY